MLTTYTPSGDAIPHERRVVEGEAVDECRTCGVWPCQPVLDAEASLDRYVTGRSA